MIVLFGVSNSIIKQFFLDKCTCPNCQSKEQQRFTIYGHYFTLFFIPMFPLHKRITAECVHCRVEIPKSIWNEEQKIKFSRVMDVQPVKRPLWHSLGCLTSFVLVTIIIVTLVVAYYKVKDNRSWDTNTEYSPDILESEYEYEEETAPIVVDSIETFFK